MTEDQISHDTPVLDLSRYKEKWTHGHLTMMLTWWLPTGRGCLVVVPTFDKWSHDRIRPCVIHLDEAFLWAEETGDGAHAAQRTFEFSGWLGLSRFDTRSLIMLTSFIREHLGDLLMCPPMPESEKEVMAEIVMTNTDTGRSVESTVVDYV